MVAGHLRERNGIYHMVLSYMDETGKRVTPYKSTGLPVKGNKRRAEAMLDKWRSDTEIDLEKRIQECARNYSSVPQDIQFTEFMLDWLAMMKNNVEITTHASYSLTIKNQINPYFDKHYPHLKLRDLTPLQIQEYYSWELNEQGVSANTVIHRHANIRKALQYAYKTGLIDSNPADRIERPRKDVFVGSFYNEAELKQLFEAIKGDPLELPVLLAAYYGLRRSEVLGLKWDAVDFEKKTVTIRHVVTEAEIDSKLTIIEKDRTKTKSSHRVLPLVKPFEDALLRLKEKQNDNRKLCGNSYSTNYLDYINVNAIGERLKPGYLTAHFPLILERNGLRRIRFHDLRHSCASLLYSNGVSMKEIQEWLGHSNISTTANIYTHLEYNSKIASANAILSVCPAEM